MTGHNTETIEYIDHYGRVKSIDSQKRTLTVSLSDSTDCGECPAARLCAATQGKQEITIPVDRPSAFTPGMTVRLRGTERMHRRAIMLATVIPCVALVAVMTAVFITTGSQLTAALCGLAAIGVFYVALYAMRNRVAHEFSFEATPAPDHKPNHD